MTRGTPRRYRTAAGTPRRQPRVRRASAGMTPARAAAVLAMLASVGAIFGLSSTSAFGFEKLEITGTSLTSESAIRSALALTPGTNLVGLSTGPLAVQLRGLPAVRDVEVSVGLPDTLRIAVTERKALLVWAVGDRRFAVDGGGLLFADTTDDASGATAATPVVVDERSASSGLAVGSVLEAVVIDAATRLGSLRPADIGSHAEALAVHVTDNRGFTVSSGAGGWVAVFGFYGTSQRTPALIPGQVQLLGGLLTGREDGVQTIILADDREGTFIPKATARPSATPKP